MKDLIEPTNPDELELRDDMHRAHGHVVPVRLSALRNYLQSVKDLRRQLADVEKTDPPIQHHTL